MAGYTVPTWQDSPSTATALSAANLNQGSTAIRDLDSRVTQVVANAKQDYGAAGNGSTDDTTAIQNAINAVATAGGGVVYLPPGTYVATQLVIKNRVWLTGAGLRATVLKHKAAATGDFVINYKASGSEANGQSFAIRHLMLDGTGAGTPSNGIHVEQSSSQTAGDDWNDARWLIEHVIITGFHGDGFTVLFSRNEGRLFNVHAFDNDGYGFKVTGSDCFFVSCNAGASGLAGFWSDGTSDRFVNCKSWFSGQVTPASGHGYHLNDTAPGGSSWVNCEAQDNAAAGWRIENGSHRTIISGCVADSNSTRGAGANAAFELDSTSNCVIEAIAYERQVSSTQTNALTINNSCVNNVIRLNHSAHSGATVGNAIGTSNSIIGNSIWINAQDGCQTPSFAASFTPNPYAGSIHKITGQNANTTVNNTTNQHAGCRMTLIFVKDATVNNYTFTWGTQYKTGVASTTTTASIRTTINFVFDGTNWQQVSSDSRT